MRGGNRDVKLCNVRDEEHLGVLSQNATVTCGLCGAKSHDPENVCDPVQIPHAGMLGD